MALQGLSASLQSCENYVYGGDRRCLYDGTVIADLLPPNAQRSSLSNVAMGAYRPPYYLG